MSDPEGVDREWFDYALLGYSPGCPLVFMHSCDWYVVNPDSLGHFFFFLQLIGLHKKFEYRILAYCFKLGNTLIFLGFGKSLLCS